MFLKNLTVHHNNLVIDSIFKVQKYISSLNYPSVVVVACKWKIYTKYVVESVSFCFCFIFLSSYSNVAQLSSSSSSSFFVVCEQIFLREQKKNKSKLFLFIHLDFLFFLYSLFFILQYFFNFHQITFRYIQR